MWFLREGDEEEECLVVDCTWEEEGGTWRRCSMVTSAFSHYSPTNLPWHQRNEDNSDENHKSNDKIIITVVKYNYWWWGNSSRNADKLLITEKLEQVSTFVYRKTLIMNKHSVNSKQINPTWGTSARIPWNKEFICFIERNLDYYMTCWFFITNNIDLVFATLSYILLGTSMRVLIIYLQWQKDPSITGSRILDHLPLPSYHPILLPMADQDLLGSLEQHGCWDLTWPWIEWHKIPTKPCFKKLKHEKKNQMIEWKHFMFSNAVQD